VKFIQTSTFLDTDNDADDAVTDDDDNDDDKK